MKADSVLKFYFSPKLIEYFVIHYFNAVDAIDVFRNATIKYGAVCYRSDKQFSDIVLFVIMLLVFSHACNLIISSS